jgi:hypothetical protein
LDLHCIFILQWPYIDFTWEIPRRPYVTTRWCNEVKERVGAALSKKTEPRGPSSASPNKRSKLEAGIVQKKQGTRKEINAKRHLSIDFADD